MKIAIKTAPLYLATISALLLVCSFCLAKPGTHEENHQNLIKTDIISFELIDNSKRKITGDTEWKNFKWEEHKKENDMTKKHIFFVTNRISKFLNKDIIKLPKKIRIYAGKNERYSAAANHKEAIVNLNIYNKKSRFYKTQNDIELLLLHEFSHVLSGNNQKLWSKIKERLGFYRCYKLYASKHDLRISKKWCIDLVYNEKKLVYLDENENLKPYKENSLFPMSEYIISNIRKYSSYKTATFHPYGMIKIKKYPYKITSKHKNLSYAYIKQKCDTSLISAMKSKKLLSNKICVNEYEKNSSKMHMNFIFLQSDLRSNNNLLNPKVSLASLQLGNSTTYLSDPEEIVAVNFALLFSGFEYNYTESTSVPASDKACKFAYKLFYGLDIIKNDKLEKLYRECKKHD